LQATSPDQFNLFVLALRELQNVDEQQMTSYYQIAGMCLHRRRGAAC